MIESVESTEKLREKFRLLWEFSINHDRDSALFLLTKTTVNDRALTQKRIESHIYVLFLDTVLQFMEKAIREDNGDDFQAKLRCLSEKCMFIL